MTMYTGAGNQVGSVPQNLEASVRSRDARHRTAGIGRDLIEAGLN
jgi:hypothetical protein